MGELLEYAANGGKAHGYLATPGANANGKGVVVIQEYWGLVPHIKDVADRFAKEGYLAVAPDLWQGKVSAGPEEAFKLLMDLDVEWAEQALEGAAALLRSHGAKSIGFIGFCMGGQLAVQAACRLGSAVGAVVDFYGIHPHVKPDFSKLKAPLLGIFAEKDQFVPPEAAKAVDAAVKAAGGSSEIHFYDAQHAFFNDSRPEVYDTKAAHDAWLRTTEFFAKNL